MENLEFKGTKGKWSQSHRVCDDKGNYATQVYCNKGKEIATLHWYPNKEVQGVVSTYREANAKLIAAALDLLEAVQSLLKWSAHFPEAMNENILIAKDAINKALGD